MVPLPSVPVPTGIPPVNLPPVNLPPVDLPPVDLPPINLPPVSPPGVAVPGPSANVPGPQISAPPTSVPSDLVLDLVAQRSSLLASLTAGKPPLPTAPGVVIPSIPAPPRACDNGPGFLTSVIPAIPSAVAGVPAGSVPVPVPAPAVVPVAPVFNPQSASNVATYYGQPGSDVTKSLLETCADSNVDILILGFLTDVTYDGSIYPRLQLVCAPPVYSHDPKHAC